MTVFGHYAQYYDLLYRDKDYAGETEFVHRLLQRHAPGAKTIVELGCGTGVHAEHMSRMGYEVHGVDRSTEMLDRARSRLANLSEKQAARLMFFQDDIRTVRLATKADAVIALFHVMSYQARNDDLNAAFATARHHLAPGGILVFDCWYGPAVLSERPVIRVKRLEDNEINVTRIAEPVMRPNENLVDVNYHVIIRQKTSGNVEELREMHRMRYLFTPEIAMLLSSNHMELVWSEEWITGRVPGIDTWGVCFVGRTR